MLKRQKQIRTQIQRIIDAGLFGLSFWIAHLIRSNWEIEVFGGARQIEPFSAYVWFLLVVVPFAPIILQFTGFYDRSLFTSRRWIAWQLLKAVGVEVLVVIFAMFLFREQLARSVVILLGPVAFVLVFLKEELIRWWLRSDIAQEQLFKRVILAGSKTDVEKFKAQLGNSGFQDLKIVDTIDLNEASTSEFLNLLHVHSANAVIIEARQTIFGNIEKAIQACELEGVEVWLMADFFQTQISRTTVDIFQNRPVLVFRSVPELSWQSIAKSLLDFVGAAVLLIILSPLLLFTAIAIKLTSPGPIIFKQQRCGLNGRPFTMYKFRSMITDAEQRKHELAMFNEMTGPVFKISNDPRITPIGRFLRKYSIDELPQLWNVLRGEMSLVGPRPLPVDEVQRFDDLSHRRRLSVKPGLTCLWQISGRSEVKDFKEWVKLDLEYIDNWSFWLDLKILLQTIPIVLKGTGAK
jgi:exopolysaccharide biosynthesis polyprenyl glycosylphosphotransferase